MGKSRRADRVQAFQTLYGLNFADAEDEAELKRVFVKSPDPSADGDHIQARPGVIPEGFAWELVAGVWRHAENLDERVAKVAKNWKLSRIGKVELTILRIAIFEMLHMTDTPPKAVINEAIELAKAFGDDNAPGFVNGVLDAVRKSLDHG